MESNNAEMIHDKLPQKERLIKLNRMAKRQLAILLETQNPLLLDDKNQREQIAGEQVAELKEMAKKKKLVLDEY